MIPWQHITVSQRKISVLHQSIIFFYEYVTACPVTKTVMVILLVPKPRYIWWVHKIGRIHGFTMFFLFCLLNLMFAQWNVLYTFSYFHKHCCGCNKRQWNIFLKTPQRVCCVPHLNPLVMLSQSGETRKVLRHERLSRQSQSKLTAVKSDFLRLFYRLF